MLSIRILFFIADSTILFLFLYKGFTIFRLSPMQAYEVFRRKINTLCYRKSSNQKLFYKPRGKPRGIL